MVGLLQLPTVTTALMQLGTSICSEEGVGVYRKSEMEATVWSCILGCIYSLYW